MATAFKKQEWIILDTKVGVTFRPACVNQPYKVDFYYTDHEGKKQRKPRSFATVEQCRAHATRILQDAKDQVDSSKPENTTVDMLGRLYIEGYLKLKGRAQNTIHCVDLAFRTFSPYIGDKTMEELLPRNVDHARESMLKTLAVATVRNHLTHLRSASKWAVKNGYARRNVAVLSDFPEISKADRAEARQNMYVPLLETMGRILITQLTLPGTDNLLHRVHSEFLAHTGCRAAEAYKLEAKHINTENPEQMFVEVGVKNTTSYRRLPLSMKLLMVLLQLKDRWQEVEEEVEDKRTKKKTTVKHSYVFVKPDQSGIRPDSVTFRRRLTKVGKALALPASLHPHLFRHYCASRILGQGGTLEDVKNQLGHANISITSDLYSHMTLDERAPVIFATSDRLDETVKALQAVALQPALEPLW